MNRSLVLLLPFSITLLLFSSCSGTKTISTPFAEDAPDVDGSLSGWELESSVIERSNEADYYATYDDDYLYIFIDVKSPAHNQAMRQSGLIIYLSTDEDSRNEQGIAFPSGTFNLLRENPGVYDSFLNDQEWLQQPENRERLNDLEEDVFNRVMIVDGSGSSRNHGFVDKDQLQVDGIQIATGDNRRLTSIEMRVPLDSQSVYNLNGDQLWLGFEISPPDFRLQNNDTGSSASQQGYGRNQGYNQPNQDRRGDLRRQMGQYKEWFLLDLDQ